MRKEDLPSNPSSKMSSQPPAESPLEALRSIVATATHLITQGEAIIGDISGMKPAAESSVQGSSSTTTTPEDDRPDIDALAVASDSAKLLHAHSTQISLFIINEPFTPSAITRVLRQAVEGPVPALINAVQICVAHRYTALVRRDLARRCGLVLKGLRDLVSKIPLDGRILSDAQKNGSGELGGDKGSLALTGLLWASCDEVVRLAQEGVAGHLIAKVQEYCETLKDVLEELKEWGEETGDDDDDDDDFDDLDDEGKGVASAQAMVDDLLNPQKHIPEDDPDGIRPRLESCLKRLRLTTLLYQAVIKRRLKTLPKFPLASDPPSSNTTAPPAPTVCSRLDDVNELMKAIPDGFEDVAAGFYALSAADIDKQLAERFSEAIAVTEKLMRPWVGGEEKDAFTDWALKYQELIKKETT